MQHQTLKASVTRRPVFEAVDADERQLQAEHHQAVESAATTAQEAPTATPAPAQDPEQPPKRNAHALQSAFLTGNLGKPLSVFTINGIRLTGKLRQFDQFTLLLEGQDDICFLVFKHAITTIAPTSEAPRKQHQPEQGGA